VADAAQAAVAALDALQPIGPDFVRLTQRAQALAQLAGDFAQPAGVERIRWIDVSAQHARLVESPLDIGEMLGAQRRAAPKAWIFTSATLGDDDKLSWFTSATGLDDAATLRVGSPFDYAAHARLWVPLPFAKPNEAGHAAAVGALAARCAQALGGRCFVLTTTLRALPLIAESLREALRQGRSSWSCWCRAASPSARCCSVTATGAAACSSAPTASGKASTCPATRCSA
jgi:ATP-dependent DNA helicase DinG